MGGSSDDLNRYIYLKVFGWGSMCLLQTLEAMCKTLIACISRLTQCCQTFSHQSALTYPSQPFLSHSLSQRCQFCWGACQRDARTGYLQLFIYLFIYLFLGPFRNSLPRVRDPMHDGAQTCEVPGMGPLPYREPILVS